MHIKLKDLLRERAAEFVNNAGPSHMVDLTKPKEEDKLAKGEWDLNMPPTPFHNESIEEDIETKPNTISVDNQRQVGKPHKLNSRDVPNIQMTGQLADPFIGHGAGNEFYGSLRQWGSGGG